MPGFHPGQRRVQPVPWEAMPAAAGKLRAWENKKLELEMLAMQIEQSAREHETSERERNQDVRKSTTTNTTASTLKRSASAASRPSFLESLRSRSSLASHRNASSVSLASSRDVTSARSASTTATSTGGHNLSAVSVGQDAHKPNEPTKRKNPLLRFLARKFSTSNNPSARGIEGGPQVAERRMQQQPNGRVVMTNKPQPPMQKVSTAKGIGHTGGLGNTDSGKKNRSNTFAEKLRIASGKVKQKMQSTWKRLNSKTPKEELPKTWEEWQSAYARGDLDLADVPEPPERAAGQTEKTPKEAGFLPAPLPADHKVRQQAFNRLDMNAKRGVKPSAIPVSEGEDPLPDSLEGHPAFRNIVTQARQLFSSSISIITVFNEDKQLFLAETGLGGMREVPREVTFCSHAVLQRPVEPFILTDTHKDWRFASSPLVTGYGCRAYYGVPLLAPDFSGSGGDGEQVPIGTLCIIDDKPHEDGFTAEQKAKMGDLALLAQKTIANWSRARLQARLDAMEKSFIAWKDETAELGPAALAETGPTRPISMQLANGDNIPAAASNAKSIDGESDVLHIHHKSRDNVSTVAHTTGDEASFHTPAASYVGTAPTATDGGTMTTGGTERQRSNKQRIYDISTRLIANSLELSLVYILQLDMTPGDPATAQDAEDEDISRVKSLGLISAFGLPQPEPAFDAVLHLKALRSAEGGLLYQNPDVLELEAGEKLPKTEEVEYASALLVPICESEDKARGYILAGFTDDPERVFERSDLEYMATISSELSVYLQD